MTCTHGTNLGDHVAPVADRHDGAALTGRPAAVTDEEIRASKARVRARLLLELVRRDLDAVHASREALTAVD